MDAYPPAIVLDCSVIIGVMFPDDSALYCARVDKTLQESRVLVPRLFFYETANVLLMQMRRGNCTSAQMFANLRETEMIVQETVDITDRTLLLLLAQQYALTAYDAAYLAVAKLRHAPLATTDAALKKAAIGENLYYNPVA